MSGSNHKEITKYWSDLSEYDIVTAKFLFKTKRYPYCLFMCHLSIEKILKALVVQETKNFAPYSHNLIDLAKQLELDLSEEDKNLLADLTEFNLEARYPEWQKKFYAKATPSYTKNYLLKTIDLQKCLKKSLKK